MKYVLIIGAKNELGIELANLYARNNYNLYLAGRSIKDIQDKSHEIEDDMILSTKNEENIDISGDNNTEN